jgi:hypothetical protein
MQSLKHVHHLRPWGDINQRTAIKESEAGGYVVKLWYGVVYDGGDSYYLLL